MQTYLRRVGVAKIAQHAKVMPATVMTAQAEQHGQSALIRGHGCYLGKDAGTKGGPKGKGSS